MWEERMTDDTVFVNEAYGEALKELVKVLFGESLTDPAEALRRFATGVDGLREVRAQAIALVSEPVHAAAGPRWTAKSEARPPRPAGKKKK
jgi:hypothetical protein